MRIGLIADIHGNQVALDAVLRMLEADRVDRIVCLGDVCALGPRPRECVRRLVEIGCPTVLGNTDDWLLTGLRFASGEVDPLTASLVEWCRDQLSTDDVDALQGYQPTLRLAHDDWSLECFHGSPLSYNDVLGAHTEHADVERMLAGHDATIWTGGHTHIQMVRRYRDGQIVNPGSVGLPGVGPGTPGLLVNHDVAWAEYALVTIDAQSTSIDLRRTTLDVDAMLEDALHSGMPHYDWWRELYRT